MHIWRFQIRGGQLSIGSIRSRRAGRLRIVFGLVAGAALFASTAMGQQDPPPPPHHPILLPEANHLPDVNDQLKLHQQNAKKQDFDAANAERKRQLDDESAKLLILARDLKTQMDNIGTDPLPPRVLREAEVIEILARDVKEKMKMTVGGS
jgi:hypothetical protein